MKLLFVTNNSFTVDGVFAMMRVETDGTSLYVTVGKIPRSTIDEGEISLSGTYNGQTEDLSSNNLSGKTAVFPYSDNVKEITLSGAGIWYNSTSAGSVTFSWNGSYADPTPEVSVDFTGIRYGDNYKFTFGFGANGGYKTYLIGAYVNTFRDSDRAWYRLTLKSGKQAIDSLSGNVTSVYNGSSKVEFSLYFAIYRSSNDGTEEYIGLYEYVSPVYYITEPGFPLAPFDLECESSEDGREIFWDYIPDDKFESVEFELERYADGEYETVYRGSDTAYSDTEYAGVRGVKYRVRAVSGNLASPWVEAEDESSLIPSGTNVYVCVDGEIVLGSAVYVGIDGVPTLTCGKFTVR